MLKLTCIFFFTMCFVSTFSLADVLRLKSDAPERYVVKKGDTLWDISTLYLNSPWNWPKLWGMNLQIENPHLIYPGDVLTIQYNSQGEPKLVVNSNSNGAKKQIKLSPGKRITPKDANAIASIPLNVIAPYLSNQRLLPAADYQLAPMVLGGDTNTKNKVPGDLIYAKGQLIENHLYGIYKQIENKQLSEEGEPLIELILTGTARVQSSQDNLSRLTVVSSQSEIKQGERLFSMLEDQSLPAYFQLSKLSSNLNAEIISAASQFREFGQHEVVIINAGANDGLTSGNVLGIYRQSPDVLIKNGKPVYSEDADKWNQLIHQLAPDAEQMPTEKIGHLVVFKVYPTASYAFVTQTDKALAVGDKVNQP